MDLHSGEAFGSFCACVFCVAGLQFGFILSSGPLLGAPVFYLMFVYMLPVLYRPSCFTSG